ncbi:hypothetical protein QE152_g38199 [Popillia japonica]|uniref:Uncharacterized protein n=1 Tax=Popillia japonica TaxID=7064 RepID=A0AAW1I885_POPJA
MKQKKIDSQLRNKYFRLSSRIWLELMIPPHVKRRTGTSKKLSRVFQYPHPGKYNGKKKGKTLLSIDSSRRDMDRVSDRRERYLPKHFPNSSETNISLQKRFPQILAASPFLFRPLAPAPKTEKKTSNEEYSHVSRSPGITSPKPMHNS